MATLATADAADRASDRNAVFDLGPGAHECWYPVALSSDLAPGQVIGRDIGDGRIVIYRGEDGAVRAMSASCMHRSVERRVGKECVRTCRFRWATYYLQKKITN